MNFYNKLHDVTEQDRNYLLSSAIIGRCMTGRITLQDYVEFLSQAYHHVKHTVPLLMAVGARLPEDKEWLREAVAEYIEEELGHQEWILNDIAACGFDKETVRNARPSAATELMVAYAYDTIQRVNPVGFFGMVLVLEGTSVTTADKAADAIQQALDLPARAFTYLRSHGALDQDHIKFFEDLMNRIVDEKEQEQIIHSARIFYRLYADIFRSIGSSVALAA
jgi:pyrroloquinoline quinone (PQQ) biosynthesis protein C